MDTLLIKYLSLITQSEVGFERSSFAKLPWEQRLLGVIRACSTLKKSTVFLLIYISVDDFYFP